MPNLSELNISNLRLKVLIFAHFILFSLSMLGDWAPRGYLFYNMFLIILLLWSLIDKESEDPVQLAFVANIASIILDIFVLAFRYPGPYNAAERFSAALAILYLLFRPFTFVLLLQMLRQRSGNPDLVGNIFPSRRNETYEDIDGSNPPPANNAARGNYDFPIPHAQQI